MSSTRGASDGSDIDEEHINVLRHRRKLPPAELVSAWVHGAENSRAPWDGEVVVLVEHFARGLGLLPSRFFASFFIHYGLPPHHLAPNTVLLLSPFVTLYEGFIGIGRHLD
ncbi:hypothetical protein D1007_24836 [Hordeum vulgare]|nr:hypothetical protein D1007_24836 [Hordeum vulgare]